MSAPTPEAPTVEEPAVETPTPEAPAEETVTMSKAEADALRRRVAESERNARKLEQDQKKAAEAQAAEQGKWQELAQQREQELAQTRAEAERTAREARITRLAGKHKFIDPSDVISRVTADEGVDDAAVEAALERIAQASPHLVAKDAPAVPEIGQVHSPSPSVVPQNGRPQPPPGKAPLQSLDEANALSVPEAVARMDEIEWLERHQK